jgi:hypothetical protein
MGFFSRSPSAILKRTWRYTPGGIIWRILPAGRGRIIGEARLEDLKQVEFFCLDERTGAVVWEKRDFGLGWWCGVEGMSSSVLFLHGFASPDLPLHRSVYAIDTETGSMLWSDLQLRFARADADALYAREEGRAGSTLVALDPRTGTRRQTWMEGDTIPDAILHPPEEGGADEPAFPVPLELMEAEMPDAAAHVRRLCSAPGAKIEVLVEGGLIIAACTVVEVAGGARRVNSAVHVLEGGGGRVLYHEDVSGAGDSPAPAAFYVRENMLIYLRERTTLTGVDLVPAQKHRTEGNAR